jgi:hypothetical protein
LGALALAATIGCASTSTSSTRTSTTLFREVLDEWREIELRRSRVQSYENGWLVDEYFELSLRISPRKEASFRQVLKKVDAGWGKQPSELDFHNVEARTDETRQRLWLVDRDASRIIATLDQGSGQTTGPDDDPPPWATPEGGVPLGAHAD